MMHKSRKSPKQSRSKATVEAILQATTRILLEGGTQLLTTNYVAERAGISIGSLYQYFPNKESLIAALIEQHVEHEVDGLTEMMSAWSGPQDERFFRHLIHHFIQIHLDDIDLTKLLHQQVHSLACREALRKATLYFELLIGEVIAKKLNKPVTDRQVKIKAFIATTSIDSLVQTALIENTELLTDALFLDELVAIVLQIFKASSK